MRWNMTQLVAEWTNGQRRRALPILTYPGLGLIGKSILDVIRDGRSQAQCITALARRYPSAAAVTIMDLSVEAEAFGSPVHYSSDEVPTVASRIVTSRAEVDALPLPRPGDARTGVYIEAARLAASAIDDRPVLGGHIGPISLAGRLYDVSEIMIALMEEPDTAHALLDKCTRFLIDYAQAFKQAGANGLIIAEPAAGLMSPRSCAEFSSQYVKRIVDAVQDEQFMVILHNCGNTRPLIPSMLATGAAAFHVGNAVQITDILPQVPAERLVLGNLDPVGTFRNATSAEVERRTLALLQATSGYTNYVLSSGCDVPPGTPIANVEAFYSALDQYNRY